MKRFVLIVSAVLLLAASCTKEGHPYVPDGWSDSFSALMDAYYEGKYFSRGDVSDDFTLFIFTDGTIVSLPRDEVKTIDARLFDAPAIAEDPTTGEWTVNKVRTWIKADRTLSVEDSLPLCVWFDDNCVYIEMSNGMTLVIGNDPSRCLESFTFLVRDNIGLQEGIACGIDGRNVVGFRPPTLTNFLLAPRFSFRGKSITVDGVPQESGKTKQDFSSDVIYDVELFDGSIVSFTVTLKIKADFPCVYIYTRGNAEVYDRETYIPGTIRIEDPMGDYCDEPVLLGDMRIRGRGNSSWANFPKKPYRIKLEEKAKVFGMPANKDWILLASYSDKTFLRDMVGMELSRICELSWTPKFFPVELYMNNSYMGVYLLGDHKEVAKHRVDIEVAGENDNSGYALTGGYYFEIEQQMDEPVCFWTNMGVPMMFKAPEHPTDAQQKYVQSYFGDFEMVLTGGSFADPVNGYARYIDVDSFVNYYIIKELTKDIDGNLRKSSFLVKERGKKLEMYHVWDFDLTLGNCDYFDDFYGLENGPRGFFIKDYGLQGYGTGWYYRLFKDPAFKAKVKKRWNEVKPKLNQVPSYIDTEAAFIRPAADRNFKKWDILNVWVWPNVRVTGSYMGEVAYLKEFYRNRLEWLDTEINKW